MSVVLVTAHGEPRAGYRCGDCTGISYEYPDGRYEAWITTGDRFVYHTPDVGWYYEVKGTQASEPLFFISEGELKFTLQEASRYTLLVVVGIDLRNGTCASIVRHDGEVGGVDVKLETAQWCGRLLAQ